MMPQEYVADVAAQTDAHDQHDHQPHLLRIEHIERVVRLVRQHRQHDERDQDELHDRLDVRVPQLHHDPMQLRLELQQHGDTGSDGHGNDDRPAHAQRTNREHHQHRRFRGDATIRLGADLPAPQGNHRHRGQQSGGNDPASKRSRQNRTQRTQDCHQRKRTHAAQRRIHMLPLQTDQATQQQRDRQTLKELRTHVEPLSHVVAALVSTHWLTDRGVSLKSVNLTGDRAARKAFKTASRSMTS